MTTIPEEEYKACREYFLQYPDHSPPYMTSTSSARFRFRVDTRTRASRIEHLKEGLMRYHQKKGLMR
ncbi:hypothetical protein OS493_034854 [Desmophyllum pertusum]|uniref:Uncharacterized protein n=1 Tax=Desmophyllum pertusum TaxID=174260 RepID=A0A9W9ZXR1_9CNID|nr:hypothetical protein OS493_034854 [Desmophyllum pertusum]